MTDAEKSGKSLADLPPPQPSAPDPSFIPCPHCGRRFSALAGERHIPHCKNIKAKVRAAVFWVSASIARLYMVQHRHCSFVCWEGFARCERACTAY